MLTDLDTMKVICMNNKVICKTCEYEKVVDGIYFCTKYNKPSEGELMYNGNGELIDDKHKPEYCMIDKE